MGLLDDAIREHLELKRKSGGDLSEIDRLEHEALSPVRRPGDPVEEPEAAVPVADVAIPEEPAPEPEPVVEEPVAEEPEPEPEPEPEFELEPEPVAEEPEPEPAAEAPLPDHLGQPTVEFSVEEHLASEPETEPAPEPAPGDEDVLEETPDFLQETPEHDRLWFEQKPPRDFDFDG